MTLMQMIQEGNVLNLIIMGALVIGVWLMFRLMDKGLTAKTTGENQAHAEAVHKPADNAAVTAAISTAINEFRKNK